MNPEDFLFRSSAFTEKDRCTNVSGDFANAVVRQHFAEKNNFTTRKQLQRLWRAARSLRRSSRATRRNTQPEEIHLDPGEAERSSGQSS
ncbi:hypothetical protein EYF80_066263 [Liparis tanakae]|uniref:Uncharacterized protein n=1 Tax=Liparis tanakae TaxID=230148 RepID=A0A4Z2E486_9TELE|nr:hypothetical protein EYF80_066263 [Liparis tanakae]